MQLRATWIWTAALVALALAAGVASAAHGQDSRRPAVLPPEAQGRRWAAVGDAAAAFRVWEASGAHGRQLVVLTGRWSKPRSLRDEPPTDAELAGGKGLSTEMLVDVRGALYVAAQVGIARRLEVVMPGEAYQRRRAEVSGQKDLQLFDGAFDLPYEGLERRFSKPEAFRAPPEPVLLLVEPSWFQGGAPSSLPAWLASRGLSIDLGLVALDDPAATDGQREEARRLAEALGAVSLEAAE